MIVHTDPCTRSVFQFAYECEFHSGYLLRSEYPMPVNKQDVAAAGIPMASQTDTALKLQDDSPGGRREPVGAVSRAGGCCGM